MSLYLLVCETASAVEEAMSIRCLSIASISAFSTYPAVRVMEKYQTLMQATKALASRNSPVSHNCNLTVLSSRYIVLDRKSMP
jgi:hypothetical protein